MTRIATRDIRASIVNSAIMLAFAALVLAATTAIAADGAPTLADWNSPPASWEAASEAPQYASVPGVDTNRLIQSAGPEWRALRNGPITRYGGWLLAIVLAAIAAFYLAKGPVRLRNAPSGRLIQRFNAVERYAHWTMAISFVGLAITGIVILWGKHIVLPWLGYSGFSSLTMAAKKIHDFTGPLFVVSLVFSFLLFAKDNVLRAPDIDWIKRFGGMFSGEEMSSGRFNGLEKVWFWGGLVLLGGVVGATGLILDFPNWNQGRELMQQANVIHSIAALLFLAASFGHIYIGTIGMEGAYRAMRDGYVDEEWARQHHALWYEEVKRAEHAKSTHAAPPERLLEPKLESRP